MKRLPPQPTNTALARLVARIVNAMPWIMARHLRECRAQRIKLGYQLDQLGRENYQLRRDYQTLFGQFRSVANPTPDLVRLALDRKDYGLEAHLRFSVEYRPLCWHVAIPARDVRLWGISEVGSEALRQAATEIAREHVPTHRDHLIRLALNGKTIAEVMKA